MIKELQVKVRALHKDSKSRHWNEDYYKATFVVGDDIHEKAVHTARCESYTIHPLKDWAKILGISLEEAKLLAGIKE
jgi:hypothetical protein